MVYIDLQRKYINQIEKIIYKKLKIQYQLANPFFEGNVLCCQRQYCSIPFPGKVPKILQYHFKHLFTAFCHCIKRERYFSRRLASGWNNSTSSLEYDGISSLSSQIPTFIKDIIRNFNKNAVFITFSCGLFKTELGTKVWKSSVLYLKLLNSKRRYLLILLVFSNKTIIGLPKHQLHQAAVQTS